MRSVELAKVAAAAEALRLRRLARRQAIRAVVAVVAALFALAAFALLHVVGYVALCNVLAPWLAALIVFAVDIVIAGVLVSVALSSGPDRIEREALMVRRQSLAEARKALTVMAVVGEMTGLALSTGTRRALRGPRLGRILTIADIASRFVRRR